MFDQLFNCRQTVVRHESAPLLEERICYLQDCRDVGSPRGTLRRKAHELLVIVDQMNLPPGGMIDRKDMDILDGLDQGAQGAIVQAVNN